MAVSGFDLLGGPLSDRLFPLESIGSTAKIGLTSNFGITLSGYVLLDNTGVTSVIKVYDRVTFGLKQSKTLDYRFEYMIAQGDRIVVYSTNNNNGVTSGYEVLTEALTYVVSRATSTPCKGAYITEQFLYLQLGTHGSNNHTITMINRDNGTLIASTLINGGYGTSSITPINIDGDKLYIFDGNGGSCVIYNKNTLVQQSVFTVPSYPRLISFLGDFIFFTTTSSSYLSQTTLYNKTTLTLSETWSERVLGASKNDLYIAKSIPNQGITSNPFYSMLLAVDSRKKTNRESAIRVDDTMIGYVDSNRYVEDPVIYMPVPRDSVTYIYKIMDLGGVKK